MSEIAVLRKDIVTLVGQTYRLSNGLRFTLVQSKKDSQWKGKIYCLVRSSTGLVEATAHLGRIYYWIWKYQREQEALALSS